MLSGGWVADSERSPIAVPVSLCERVSEGSGSSRLQTDGFGCAIDAVTVRRPRFHGAGCSSDSRCDRRLAMVRLLSPLLNGDHGGRFSDTVCQGMSGRDAFLPSGVPVCHCRRTALLKTDDGRSLRGKTIALHDRWPISLSGMAPTLTVHIVPGDRR